MVAEDVWSKPCHTIHDDGGMHSQFSRRPIGNRATERSPGLSGGTRRSYYVAISASQEFIDAVSSPSSIVRCLLSILGDARKVAEDLAEPGRDKA
jgi:hypothetical protein